MPNFRLKLNKVQSVRGKVQKLVAAGSGRGARESSRALLAPRFPSQPPGAPGGTGGDGDGDGDGRSPDEQPRRESLFFWARTRGRSSTLKVFLGKREKMKY